MINKQDYLKNYSDIEIQCRAKINNKNYAGAFLFDFDPESKERELKDNKADFMKKAECLYNALERIVLFENGYNEDLKKELDKKLKESYWAATRKELDLKEINK